MGLPTDLVPVTQAKPVQATAPKDLIPIFPNQVRTINTPGTGANVLLNQQIAKVDQPIGDELGARVDLADIRPDEKDFLKKNRSRLTPEQFEYSLGVFENKEANFWTKNQYYYDREGIPQQIKFGEHAPDYAHVQSVFGGQAEADDDNALTTFGKTAFNSFLDIVKLPATLVDLGYNLFGGADSTDFSDWLRTSVDEHKFTTSEKSQVPFLSEKDLKGDPWQNLAQVLDPTNFDFNTQNIAGALGSAVGMIGQIALLGGGGEAAAAEGEALSLSQKILPFAKKTGANTLWMINGTYDEARNAGLTGHERFAVSLVSAIGQGVIMAKLFPEVPASVLGKETQAQISKSAVDAFVKASGGKLTAEALEAAYKETLAKSAEVLPKSVSKLPAKVKTALQTGGVMVANHAFDNAVMSFDANLTGRTDENELFSPKAFAQYFNSFVAGTAMGVVGGVMHKSPEEQTDTQSKMAYAYIREGREAELVHNLNGLLANDQLTPQQHADAINRIGSYKRYATETRNVKLNDEEREQVFNNIFKDEKIKQHIDALEKDTTTTPAFKEAQIKVLRSESTGYVNEIAKLLGRKETPAETAKAADKTGTEFPGEKQKTPVSKEPAPGSKTENRNKIVSDFIAKNPKFIHQKPVELSPGVFQKTETLGGGWTIEQDGKRAQMKVKAGSADPHDKIEAERYEARKRLKVGDVLEVRRFLPGTGKRFRITGREGTYRNHLLNVFDQDGVQVGSITYNSENDARVHKLMDEGHDVRVVITSRGPKDALEYQIVSAPREGQTKDIVRARHEMPVEGREISARELHENIVHHLATKRSPREPINTRPLEPMARPEETPEEQEMLKMVLEGQENSGNSGKVEKTAEKVSETPENISEPGKTVSESNSPEIEGIKKPEPLKPVLEKPTVSEMDVASGIVHLSRDGKYRVAKTPEGIKVFDAKSKEPSKTTANKIIKEYLRTFDFEKGESALEGIPEGTIPESDIDQMVAEHSNKPSELIDTFTRVQSDKPIILGDYVDEIIAQNIGKIKGKSYNEFGDKNNVTMGKAKAYFANSGDSIDTLAQYLTEVAGTEITPQDVVDFIDRFPAGSEQYFREQKNPLLAQLSDRFFTITGFKLSPRSIEAYRDQQLAAYKIEESYFQKEFESYEEAKQAYEKDIAEGRISPDENGGSDVSEKDGNGRSDSESEGEIKAIPFTDPDQLDGVSPENILHFNQGDHYGRVTLLVDADIKSNYSKKASDHKKISGDTTGLKDQLRDIAKKHRIKGGDDIIIDLRGKDISQIKYQSDATEKLASDDPELQQHILARLVEQFPKVSVFTDAERFQSFLDRNFTGARLDMEKLGAAVKNAVYINPNRAVQSTAIHEFAHIYWDSLPENDATKKALAKFFPDEESAITGIGKIGTKSAEIGLKGTALQKFMEAARKFWAKVKDVFGLANEKDLTRIFADKIWNAKLSGEVKAGSVKFQSAELTPEQDRTVSQLRAIAEHFDYNDAEHTYTLKQTGVQYKPVNDILEGDKKYSYKGKSNPESSQRGKDLHALAEAIVRSEDFEAALAKTGLKMTPEAKEQFRSQVSKVIEFLRGKGSVLPETIFANSYFKTAGRPDLPIVDKDGTLHIYDFKTSTMSTEGALYESASGQKAAKKDRDGTQLAMYAKLAEHGDATLGLEPQKIGDSGIIPIRITVDKDGLITRVTVEKTVDVPYDNYRDEARRLLSKQHKGQAEKDSTEFKHAGAKSKSQYMKFHKIDERALEDELANLGETEADNKRAEEIYSILEQAQAQYEKYKQDFQKVKNLEDADLSKYSYEELIDTINTINSYDSLLHNIAMKEIQVEAGRRMSEMETERLAKKGIKAGPEKDFGSVADVFFTALSDIPETLPALQGRVRDYFAARQAEETEHADTEREAKRLFMDVIREKERDMGVINKLTKSFRKSDLSKYFENLFLKKADEDGPALLKDWKDLSNNLSQKERAVLKFMSDKMSEFQQKQALSERGYWDGFYAEISPNFWETYQRHGFLSALGAKFREDQPDELGDMEVMVNIDGDKKLMTYDEAEKAITEAGKKNILTKAAAALKLTRAYGEAKKALDVYTAQQAGTDSAIRVRGAASRFTLNDNGEMVGKFHWKRPEGKEISYDVYRSFMSYMTDAIHVKHMQPLLPELSALETYYKERGANPNTVKFMQHWIEGDIFGKEFVGQFGRKVDAGVKFMQGWTYLNVMSFNPVVGKFNFITGKANQLRAEGFKKTIAKGEPRYWKNPRKAQGILAHYTVIEPTQKGPDKMTAENIWGRSANAFVSMGENSIRGAAFFSNLTDAEWKQIEDNFDAKGNIIDKSKDLDPGRVFQIKKKTEDIQGKYAFSDKRMYKHYGMMSAMMGFKGWMPDWLKERLGGEYVDAWGQTHKGSLLSLPYIFRDLKQVMTDWNSENVDVKNNQKTIRGALLIGSMLGIYALSFGTKEEKKKGAILLTMANDMMGVFNLSRTKTSIGKPFPFLGTVSNFVDAMSSLTQFYTRDGKFGEKGDWMFPGKVLNVLPYNHAVRSAVQEIANPNYSGN